MKEEEEEMGEECKDRLDLRDRASHVNEFLFAFLLCDSIRGVLVLSYDTTQKNDALLNGLFCLWKIE